MQLITQFNSSFQRREICYMLYFHHPVAVNNSTTVVKRWIHYLKQQS